MCRPHVIPNASVTFEISGIKTPLIDQKYEAKYIDWDLRLAQADTEFQSLIDQIKRMEGKA